MKTNFTAEQLTNPRLAEAKDILEACVHCGLCNATCPTYVLSGDERESPRGRIYLIKSMLEGGKAPQAVETRHIDSCLGCLSCETTCPYGVEYMHLLDHARAHVQDSGSRSIKERAARRFFLKVVPDPDLLRSLFRYARFARPFAKLFKRFGFRELAAMLDLAPAGLLPSASFSGPGLAATKQERRKRIALLAGCTQQVLHPQINDATIRLLARRGVDVEVAAGAGCCGGYARALGSEDIASQLAQANIDAWMKLISKGDLDAVITTGAGCGTTVKDYPRLLKYLPDYEWKAAQISGMTRDITEFLDGFDLGPPKRWSSLRVAYHSACSMQHGQKIEKAPRALLRKAGFAVVDVPEAHLCCGGAGGYNMLHPEVATELRDRKAENIDRAKPDLVACGDINCIAQLSAGMETPVVHTVELLDWAYGGPVPKGLEKLAALVNDVPESDVKSRKPLIPMMPLPRRGGKSAGGTVAAENGQAAPGGASADPKKKRSRLVERL